MKKIVFALVVLMLAVPASAAVTITCVQDPCDAASAIIGYTGDDVVRCFGLNIKLNNDETITAVECLSNDYYVNPGNFTYDGINPGFGDPACLCDAGEPDTLGGIDTNGITIAMCSLYADNDPDHNLPPAAANGLVKITVSGSCCITIAENGKRGGVIDEDNVDIEPTLPNDPCLCLDLGCFPSCHPDYDEWVAVGSPESWCYPRQCHGDADGLQQQVGWDNWYVASDDLTILISGWLKNAPLAADFDHDSQQVGWDTWRVASNDLIILINNWLSNPASDCLDCP